MSQRWQQFLRRPAVWSALSVAALLNAATLVLVLLRLSGHSEPIVLHTTVYFGADLIGPWERALFIPAFGALLLVFNAAAARAFFDTEKLFSYFFLVLTPVFELLLLFAVLFIILNLPVGT